MDHILILIPFFFFKRDHWNPHLDDRFSEEAFPWENVLAFILALLYFSPESRIPYVFPI